MLKELLKLPKSWRPVNQIPEGYILERAEAGDGDVCEFTPFDPSSIKNKKLRKALVESALLRIEILVSNGQDATLWLECPFKLDSQTHAYFRITKKQTPAG